MNLLLDTQVLVWRLDDSPQLSGRARALIADGRNPGFVSAATVCEIRIKEALGRLQVPRGFRQAPNGQPFVPLPITEVHGHAIEGLPMRHRHPFDRMLVAQAKCERPALVSRDGHLRRYGISLVEAWPGSAEPSGLPEQCGPCSSSLNLTRSATTTRTTCHGQSRTLRARRDLLRARPRAGHALHAEGRLADARGRP